MNRVLLVLLLCVVMVAGVFAQTPPTPTNLTAVVVNGTTHPRVQLTWDGPRGPWNFRVSRSVNDTLHFQRVGTTYDTMFVDGNVMPGTPYNYFVTAFSMQGGESGRSNIASITITPPPPPPTPTNLVATLVPGWEDMSVKLTWEGARGPWSFRVFRSEDDTTEYHSVGSTPDTMFVDREVTGGSTYFYYVKAFSMFGGESGPSNVVSILVTVVPRIQGTIAGTVIDDSTQSPIQNAFIQFFRVNGPWQTCPRGVRTDSLGHYSAALDTGRYIVRASVMCEHYAGCYRPEYFDNCTEPSCATVIAVAESSLFTANFGLSRPTPPRFVYVSGTVSDTLDNPLPHARVAVIRTMQELNYLASLGMTPGTGDEAFNIEGVGHTRGVLWTGLTDSLGHYRARVVADHDYIALASKQGYLPQYYDHKQTVETADIIHVTNDTSGIDFNLAARPVPNNSISGTVRDSLGTLVPSRIILIPALHRPEPHGTRYGHTDSLGAFTLTQVEAGRYFVLAIPFSGYGPAFYKAGAYGVIRIQDADTVNITGNVTGIDVGVRAVNSAGLTRVGGRVGSPTSVPITGVRLTALDAQGDVLGIGITDGSGAYSINAVASGPVTIVADCEGYNSGQLDMLINPNVYGIDNVNLTLTPGSPTSINGPGVVPATFALNQNYPNPFNPSTKISYDLSAPGIVTLKVFNILGQEVATLVNGYSAAGAFEVEWNGKDNVGRSVASGVYLYRLHATAGATDFLQMKKMLLLK